MLQCKEKMRPVKRALKMLENPEENTSEKDQVTQTKQVKVNCVKCLYDHAALSSPGMRRLTAAGNQA